MLEHQLCKECHEIFKKIERKTKNIKFRLLEKSDFDKGYIELLSNLSHTGNISKKDFINRFNLIQNNIYHSIYVLEQNNIIISTATLIIEPKFIHNNGFVAHIEDVVVHPKYRGQYLGIDIIEFLIQYSKFYKCYKIILDCSIDLIPFYEKCNFKKNGIQMAIYNIANYKLKN
jgi:glucosamine-phosphate N-acetyltransferase